MRGESGSAPGLSPTTAKLTPTNPTPFARPQNTLAPPPCCSSFILFLDLLLLLALFCLFLVLIIPGFPQCFGFPPQPSSGCLFSLLVFLLFLRCLLVVAGQKSVFGLGKGSHVAGLGPDHHLETPAWSRRGEALGTVIAPSRNVAGVGMWNSCNGRAGSRVMGSGGKRSQTVSEELQGTIVMYPRSPTISSSPGSCLTHISTSPGCQCGCALRSLEKQAGPASASAY